MSQSLWQRLRADAFLGYRALLAHPLKKLFSSDERSGEEKFLANYGVEGLVPMSDADRAVLRGASRCIHCGLCDAYDPEISTLPRTLYDGASLLPIAEARATPDLLAAREMVNQLSDDALSRAQTVCPTRVPLRDIAGYLKRKLQAIDALKAGG